MRISRWDEPHEPYVKRALLGTELPLLEAIGFRRSGVTVEFAFIVSEIPNATKLEEISELENELLADFEWDSYDQLQSVIGLRQALDLNGYEIVELWMPREG